MSQKNVARKKTVTRKINYSENSFQKSRIVSIDLLFAKKSKRKPYFGFKH